MGLGFTSGVAEGFFYGGVNEEGVVQESFFLPLSFLLSFVGSVLLVVAIAISAFKKMKKK